MNQTRAANPIEALFRALAESMPSAIWLVKNGKVGYTNQSAQRMCGRPAEELDGLPLSALVQSASLDALTSPDSAGTAAERIEIELITPLGPQKVYARSDWLEMDHQPVLLVTAFETSGEQTIQEGQRQAAELAAVFHTLSDAVLVYGPQGDLLHANATAQRTYGFPEMGAHISELQQRFQLYSPDGQQLQPEEWPTWRALRGEEVREEPHIISTADGARYHILVSSRPLYVENEFHGAVSTYHDITERQRLLGENIRQAEQLKAILNSMAEVVILFDDQGSIILANPAARRVFLFDPTGMTCNELIERAQITYPDGRPVPAEELPTLRALSGERVVDEHYSIHAGQRELLVSISPILLEDQTGGAVAVCHDVSDRENLLAQLWSERARLSTTIENAPEGILMMDVDDRIILANQAAERLLGRFLGVSTKAGEAGRAMNIPAAPILSGEVLELIQQSRGEERITYQEITLLLPGGQERELLVKTAPVIEANGGVSGTVSIIQDIGPRKRSEQESRRAAARAELLDSLSKSFAEAGLYHAAVLTSISIHISEELRDTSIIRMLSDDGRWLDVVAVHHPDTSALRRLRSVINAHRVRVDHSLEGDSFRKRQALLISDVSRYGDRSILERQYGSWLWENNTRSMLIVPLQAQDTVLGTLTMIRNQGEPYNLEDQHFFTNLADRAALAIENSLLFLQEQQRAREMDALHSATAALLNTLDLDELLEEILNSAQRAIPAADRSVLHLVEPSTGELEVRATLNFSDSRIARLTTPDGLDYPGFVVKNREPLIINDTLTRPEPKAGKHSQSSMRSLIIAPLIIAEEVLGTLSLTAARSHAFTQDDLKLLVSFATTTSAAIQNARLHAQVQMLAITDPLTDLYNRRGFLEIAQREMDRHLRYQHPLTAIMLDIDHFKEVNDTLGHQTGDRVLRALAARVRQNIRQVDVLGRYGGEEFVLLLPDTELIEACEIGERIRTAVQDQPLVMNGQLPVNITISLGVSSAHSGTKSLVDLLEQADHALYQAKQNGRNRLEIH